MCRLFGRYQGTIRQDGLRWVNPFTSRRRISTRLHNHETAVLKVNDTAVRHIATNYPYDAHDVDSLSLRGNSADITERLSTGIAARVESAGVKASMVSNLLVVLCGDRAAQPVLNTGTLYQ